ncbi:MAG: hypothetical protein VKP63_05485 [Cyanobacteriota bacterium]|nr:hypothetical protein [Cyanobacteriota bacterium]
MAFTGDALLVRSCGRCDFQQGNPHALWTSITTRILTLPDHCLLYPGHAYTGRGATSVAEERLFNARLGELPRHKPVVVLGHSGSRSALATLKLLQAACRGWPICAAA